MNKDLQDIINKSTYTIIDGHFVYLKAKTVPSQGDHFLISKDVDEVTVVTSEDQKKYVDVIEQNKETYCLISLNVSIPFYSVGFLAAVSTAIAEEGMNILIVSTYSKDYILVKIEDATSAITVLQKLGFKSL